MSKEPIDQVKKNLASFEDDTPSVSYYSMFYSNAQILQKTIFSSKALLNYNIKLVYLIINKNRKNPIGYNVFDKV